MREKRQKFLVKRQFVCTHPALPPSLNPSDREEDKNELTKEENNTKITL
jgi:hypothetical protein